MRRAAYYSPELFFRSWLRVKYLYSWQSDFLGRIGAEVRAGARHIKALARTCHGAGKTLIAAGLCLWFMYTREEPRGLTLAPTWSGIESLLWPEMGRLYDRSLMADLGWGRMLDTELQLSRASFAVGMASDRPGNLEGQHSPTAAIRIVDEAKEVEAEIFEATEGLLNAPQTFDLWISTPSIEEGEFWKRDLSRDSDVIRTRVTVDDLIADHKRFGYPTLGGMEAWKAERAKKWGASSPAFLSRAMAQYIRDASGKLFPSSWIEAAFERDFSVAEKKQDRWLGQIVIGQDVAGSVDGDENAVAAVQTLPAEGELGDRTSILALDSWHERDTTISRDRGHLVAEQFDAPQRIDTIGMGKGVYDAALEKGYNVEEYRASEKPVDEEQFLNRKAEEAWTFRQKLENERVSLRKVPEHLRQKLVSQFAGMKYKIGPKGKIQIIDPPDSPDLVDAILIGSSAPRLGVTNYDPEWL